MNLNRPILCGAIKPMKNIALILLLNLVCFNFQVFGQIDDPLKEGIEKIIVKIDSGETSYRGSNFISPEELIRFYQERQHSPAWWWNGSLMAQASEGLNLIASAYSDGLDPNDYHYQKLTVLNEVAKKKPSQRNKLEFEILLTDGLLTYMRHLYNGKVNHNCPYVGWYAECKELEINYSSYLSDAITHFSLAQQITKLLPLNNGYIKLKKALSQYRQLNAILPISIESLAENPIIKDQLIENGDLSDIHSKEPGALSNAVISFKARHGLEATDEVDNTMLTALNIKLDERINTILANMERWRWLPTQLEYKYVVVNIANFELDVIVNQSSVWNTKVVVGRPDRKTPVLSSDIFGVLLNPEWTVPPTILYEDILSLKGNIPSYLTKNHIEVLDYKGLAIPPDSLPWATYTNNISFPYILKQKAGDWNALGKIKFIMPNSYSVYLHDTPSKNLFSQKERALSSGCIRVSNPFELAKLLFEMEQNPKEIMMGKIKNSGETQSLYFKEPIKIHILYWTSWVDTKGRTCFRDDIYDIDKWLIKELKSTPEPYKSND